MFEDISIIVSTLGFPIVVCLWFMVRTEKVINNNTQALTLFLNKVKKIKK